MTASTAAHEGYLSTPIGKGVYATISREQFQQISDIISHDPALVSALMAYKSKWLEVANGDDDLAFAGVPPCTSQVLGIVEKVTASKDTAALSAAVMLRYLGLR